LWITPVKNGCHNDFSSFILHPKEMSVVIDNQGYNRRNGIFILKELSAFNFATGLSHSHVFKILFDLDQEDRNLVKTGKWTTTFCHGIGWYDGTVSFNQFSGIINTICNNAHVAFVKGE
jgi:hypothetical protein